MYCKAGQSTEEEMYNNESAGPAFEEFLQLLGERVRLKGFEKYRAQLDTKSKKYLHPPTGFIFLLLCWCSPAKLHIKQRCHLLQKTPSDGGEEDREGGMCLKQRPYSDWRGLDWKTVLSEVWME